MTTETILQLLTILLGTGGLLALFLISEKKTKAQMENINLAITEWQKLVEQLRRDLADTQARAKEFQDLYLASFDLNTKLRKDIDDKNTRIAVLSLLRCKKTKCIDREPPYGEDIEKEAQQ